MHLSELKGHPFFQLPFLNTSSSPISRILSFIHFVVLATIIIYGLQYIAANFGLQNKYGDSIHYIAQAQAEHLALSGYRGFVYPFYLKVSFAFAQGLGIGKIAMVHFFNLLFAAASLYYFLKQAQT